MESWNGWLVWDFFKELVQLLLEFVDIRLVRIEDVLLLPQFGWQQIVQLGAFVKKAAEPSPLCEFLCSSVILGSQFNTPFNIRLKPMKTN